MNTPLTADDLKRFCWPDIDRPTIAQPFSQGSWTYATDGRMMLRVPRLAAVAEREDAPKNLDKNIFATNPISEKWQAVPVDLPDLSTNEECETCGGSGDHECHCGHNHDCGDCKGVGFRPAKAQYVQIGIHSVSHILLHKIKDIPGIEICVSAKDGSHALGIRFAGGGEGRLMPMVERK